LPRIVIKRTRKPGLPAPSKSTPKARPRASGSRRLSHRGWFRRLLYVVGAFALSGFATFGYLYFSYSRIVDARLNGERERSLPRVYARPMELRRGQALSAQDLVVRLNDLGYAQRGEATKPGEFAVTREGISILPRGGPHAGQPVRVAFARAGTISAIRVGAAARAAAELDAPLLTALMTSGAREKRRHVPLDTIPPRMRQAVLSIEDQSFYSHPGVNPIRLAAAAIRNAFGNDDEVVGYSTITQQLARMFFLADEFNAELQSGERGRTLESYLRKAREGVMSLVLENKTTKDELLELYLNDVYLGQRGSFAIHGVAEAARIFFGKDIANVSLSEAAVIAGTIRMPSTPFTNPTRALERRNTVLEVMAGEEYITAEQAEHASREPLTIAPRTVDNAAPYFVDMVAAQVAEGFPGVTTETGEVNVYTTLDLNMQRAALDAVRNGLGRVDQLLAGRKRAERAQAALLAVDPRSGEILAMVGGRSYNNSQFNRALVARRQPGSIFKPFVFLSAFEYAYDEGRTDMTPASLAVDEAATFTFDDQTWEPRNYDDYDGEITWRRALAMSRNLATIRVGEQVGFDRIAAFWRKVSVGTAPKAVPSITLGVFELTPIEVAQAYTLFLNGGAIRRLRAIDHIRAADRDLRPATSPPKRVARPETTFLVTNMMRSVLNEGTAAGARAAGFALDAAGKTGTTNDLRDAWFAGFTPELLTVVWVGYDGNQPLSLTGTQAALPIWTEFMRAALAGHPNLPLEPPDGVVFVEIDRDTGKLALPGCPRTMNESFISGTEPGDYCELHRW
jgi:penicillin-binding protein 1B